MDEEEILSGCLIAINNQLSSWIWKRQQYERQGDEELLKDAQRQEEVLRRLYKEVDWWRKTGTLLSSPSPAPPSDGIPF